MNPNLIPAAPHCRWVHDRHRVAAWRAHGPHKGQRVDKGEGPEPIGPGGLKSPGSNWLSCCFANQAGRGSRIRTCDPLLPKQMRYQTAPCPDGTRMLAAWRQLATTSRVAWSKSLIASETPTCSRALPGTPGRLPARVGQQCGGIQRSALNNSCTPTTIINT